MKSTILGLTLDQLQRLLNEYGAHQYRAAQIAEWVYKHNATDWTVMSNLPSALRNSLERDCELGFRKPLSTVKSADGTEKYLFPAGDGRSVETALIPDRERKTICLSTQAGCRRACSFCFTAMSGYEGNLDAWAIINQYASCPHRDGIDNIVFMGMGEPFDNYEALSNALEVFTADYGYAMSPGRITVSTVGIIAGIEKYLRDSRSHLAISLNSPFPDERAKLMPAEKKNPIMDVLSMLRRQDWSGQRRLTFEYIMFADVNDSPRHSRELARLLKGVECRVNLISFNEGEGIDFKASRRNVIERFQSDLRQKGIRVTIRKSKGNDISAACGQLALRNQQATPQLP